MPTDPSAPVAVVPIQYAGQWIAWDQAGTRILASGHTIEEALRAAQTAGEKAPVFAKVPKAATRFVGGRARRGAGD